MLSTVSLFITASSHFININELEVPSKLRQFRIVNVSFLNSLEAEMERKPAGSYGALFVVAKGLSSKVEWKEEEKNNHSYEVLGGTHLSLHGYKNTSWKLPREPTLCRGNVSNLCGTFWWTSCLSRWHASAFIHVSAWSYIQGRGLSKMLLLECILETFQWCLSSSPEMKLSSKLYQTVTP